MGRDIADVDNMATIAVMIETNVAPTDLTRSAGTSQQSANNSIIGTGLQHAGEGQPQEAIDRRIAKLMAENEELRIRFNVSTIFNTPLPSITITFERSTHPVSKAANFF
ncbi:hypothetical protein TIFTF001_040472 [Ficus carica]|uniref:Uncharacterized protein n=1 Tax=Ficus carica TaxID=3494 RepID=A0AA88CMK7_FICCA|nr:hypothetical protein TIFTF001_040472 [Ficus carica]